MKYIIIGTAGHVDHGKTALIKALTGTDTDRLKEEKLRGISIDLGFASLPLADDIVAGVVDVPGHERFLKNMLAGTGGIDMAMLVVAADEGVMPQTREHLAMLHLYGISQGVVVLNKIDKVDGEWLDLVAEDVQNLLAGTFLAGAPLCRVSAVTGEGLAELRAVLRQVAERLPGRDNDAPFRLWIDRAFTVKGYGVVVTGSVLSGTAKTGDSLTLYPAGIMVRVRGLEWHGQKVEQIHAGQRAAINLAGVDLGAVERGMCLSSPRHGQVSNVWDVKVIWHSEVENGTRIRLHLGTGESIGRIYFFRDAPKDYARLVLESPVGAGAGDRGILRLYSPQHLLGGVIVVAPSLSKRQLGQARLARAEALGGDVAKLVYAVLADSGLPLEAGELVRQTGYLAEKTIERALAALVAGGRIVQQGAYYLTAEQFAALREKCHSLLASYHAAQPDRPGMAREVLRQQLGLDEKAFNHLVEHWQAAGFIVAGGAEVALPHHAARHRDWKQDLAAEVDQALSACGPISIDTAMLAAKLNLPPAKAEAAMELLQREGLLVRIGGDLVLYYKVVQQALDVLRRHFASQPTITVAQLRDLLQTSRKVALPLMEYFDLQKYTIRDGDVRRPGAKLHK